MGGEVGIESMAGQGARFWFRVKVRVVADEAARNELPDIAAATKPAAANTPAADGVVLIVDDNATNRKLIEALLRKQDIKFQSVENGEQALQFVTSRMVPALILMDCQMPVMDGYTATEKIRQWERDSGLSPLPIIALSAGAFQEDIDRCIKVGMNDFLAKPIQLNTFVATLNKWLGSSNQAN